MPRKQNKSRKKSMIFNYKSWLFVCVFMVSPRSWAFDSNYYQTLTRSYLSDGEVDQALNTIKAGLTENPGDSDLIKLRDEIETDKEKKEDAAAEAEMKQREQKQRNDEVRRLSEERTTLPRAYCGCISARRSAQKKIEDENKIGEISGVVNKVVLREAGKTIANINKTLKYMDKKATSLGVDLGKCNLDNSDEIADLLACDRFFSTNLSAIEKE